jgi:voltage-gated potassium channel
MDSGALKKTLTELYLGNNARARRFRLLLLGLDLVLVLPVLFWALTGHGAERGVNLVLAVPVVLDLAARLWTARHPVKEIFSPYGFADAAVLVSVLAPLLSASLSFLLFLRVLRLLRSYRILRRWRTPFGWFHRHEETVFPALNLVIFLYAMTGIVYATESGINPGIRDWSDALYFTVTALTTTGFGDVVMKGPHGRMISVIIMIFGVSLFLRLVQVLLRPDKVHFTCPKCGLQRHERDATHCKACGTILEMPSEGEI